MLINKLRNFNEMILRKKLLTKLLNFHPRNALRVSGNSTTVGLQGNAKRNFMGSKGVNHCRLKAK